MPGGWGESQEAAEKAPHNPRAGLLACEFCGVGFRPHHRNQRFCGEQCRRGFEKLIDAVSIEMRKGVRRAVRAVLKEHRGYG